MGVVLLTQTCLLLAVSSQGEGQGALRVPLIRALTPFMRAPPLGPIHLLLSSFQEFSVNSCISGDMVIQTTAGCTPRRIAVSPVVGLVLFLMCPRHGTALATHTASSWVNRGLGICFAPDGCESSTTHRCLLAHCQGLVRWYLGFPRATLHLWESSSLGAKSSVCAALLMSAPWYEYTTSIFALQCVRGTPEAFSALSLPWDQSLSVFSWGSCPHKSLSQVGSSPVTMGSKSSCWRVCF